MPMKTAKPSLRRARGEQHGQLLVMKLPRSARSTSCVLCFHQLPRLGNDGFTGTCWAYMGIELPKKWIATCFEEMVLD